MFLIRDPIVSQDWSQDLTLEFYLVQLYLGYSYWISYSCMNQIPDPNTPNILLLDPNFFQDWSQDLTLKFLLVHLYLGYSYWTSYSCMSQLPGPNTPKDLS